MVSHITIFLSLNGEVASHLQTKKKSQQGNGAAVRSKDGPSDDDFHMSEVLEKK